MSKPKSLARLKATWRKKLSKSGFKDIEDANGNLNEFVSTRYKSDEFITYAAQERYYQLADQLLHDYNFTSIEDKTIWRFHCQGKTIGNIAYKVGRSDTYIRSVIEEMAKRIKI